MTDLSTLHRAAAGVTHGIEALNHLAKATVGYDLDLALRLAAEIGGELELRIALLRHASQTHAQGVGDALGGDRPKAASELGGGHAATR